MRFRNDFLPAVCLVACLTTTTSAGLIGYWTFDADGTDAITGNSGTFIGDAAITAASGESRIGDGSLKVAHNTASDYFDVAYRVIPDHGVYTVTAWYKWDTSFSSNAVDERAFIYETTPSYSSGVGVYTSEFMPEFFADALKPATDIMRFSYAGNRIDDEQWHFMAVTYDAVANTTICYHDAGLPAATLAPPIVSTDGLHIGAYRSGGTRNWQGYIDDFAVYEGILPSSEIQKLYSQTATPQTVAVDMTNVPGTVPTGGLVAYWSFDSDFNSEVNADYFVSSPQGNAGGGTYTTIDTTPGAAARGVGALKLDSGPLMGNGTFVKVEGSILDSERDKQIAISAWFKYEDVSGDGSDLRNMVYETSPTYSVSLGITADRQYQWYTDTDAPDSKGFGDALIEEGQWYHVVTNYDLEAGRMQLFCNGVLVSSEAITGSSFDYTSGFNIGNHRAGDGERDFDGYIDDVAIFHGILTAEAVAGLYDGTYTPENAPLVDRLGPPVPGDTNGDGLVNQQDAAVLAGNWGMSVGGKAADGDFNGDGVVNALDAAILAAQWSPPAEASGGVAVPEPSFASLLLAGLTAVFWRRKTR